MTVVGFVFDIIFLSIRVLNHCGGGEEWEFGEAVIYRHHKPSHAARTGMQHHLVATKTGPLFQNFRGGRISH